MTSARSVTSKDGAVLGSSCIKIGRRDLFSSFFIQSSKSPSCFTTALLDITYCFIFSGGNPRTLMAANHQAFAPTGSHDRIPTQHGDHNWLQYLIEPHSHLVADGYWILRFAPETIDQKWQELCGLYASGKLPGVSHISVSTRRYNRRTPSANSNSNAGGRYVILIKCGPTDDEAGCIKILKDVLEVFPVEGRPKTFYYKTNVQTNESYASEPGHVSSSTWRYYG